MFVHPIKLNQFFLSVSASSSSEQLTDYKFANEKYTQLLIEFDAIFN